MCGQVRDVTHGDQVFFFSNGDSEILGEADKLTLGYAFAGSAEDTTPHINGVGGGVDGFLRAGGRACGHHIRWCIRVDLRPTPVAGQQLDSFLGISGCLAPLF